MNSTPRANVLGVGISALSMSEAVGAADRLLQTAGSGYVCVTGVHGVMEAQGDSGFKQVLNASFLNLPDGMPTVWVGKWQGFRNMGRVYGPDFMLELCALSIKRGYKHFLYGGKPGVAEDLREKLLQRFPGLQIVGTYTPPFRALNSDEEAGLRAMLVRETPDVFWCGISTPKQEKFMAQYYGNLPVRLMVGVGAAFDINSGRIPDAPRFMKQMGLQWVHRMMTEPRRLARRYLTNNPRFIWLTCQQLSGLRQYELKTTNLTD
jgi:N-acetylglucosaminyldiphosphoundecaprenol N-acetyl-beta-D-mannosaminyltransferase